MTKTLPVFLVLLGLAFFVQAEERKPNIIFVLADDMGYGDLGCFGQETLATPNIDRMASEGMKLTRHYSGSTVCAPSRCVLITGKHTGHCSVRGNNPVVLDPEDITVAEVLKGAGYRTGAFGKWGVGNPPPRNEPNRVGFDEFYGYVNMYHAHNFYPEFLIRNGEVEKLENVVEDKWKEDQGAMGMPREGYGVATVKKDYAPHLITNEALKFIDDSKDGPFFLYFALNVPHTNNEAGRPPYKNGMEVPAWGEFAEKDWPDPEKGFASMIRNIDGYIGRLLEKLKELDIDDDTIIFFSSDNGPHKEGGHDVNFFDSNGILRGNKRDLYEGGVRVPTIVRWPGKIEAGSESTALSGFQDFLPTAADLAGSEVPEGIDGNSMVPILTKSKEEGTHEYLYWEFIEQGGKTGVVTEKWKGIFLNTQNPAKTTFELYDLENDIEETTNVADKYPEVVGQLQKWIADSHIEPKNTP